MSESETEYLLLTRYFHPDTASTGQLMTELAVGLQERGLDMTVYTGQPNYHDSDLERAPSTDTYKGVCVQRVFSPVFDEVTFIKQLFDWMVFSLLVTVRLFVQRGIGNHKLIVVSTPPFLPLFVWVINRLRGTDYTYIVYDLWPDIGVESDYFREGGLIDWVWSAIHSRVFRDAENVISLGPAMRERIKAQSRDLTDDEVEIIHNWEDPEFIQPVDAANNWFRREQGLTDDFVILYSGNINQSHDLETVLQAATEFTDENVVFLIIGQGRKKDSLIELAEELGLDEDTVRFLPYQPIDDLPYTLTSGDVSIVTKKQRVGMAVSCKVYTSLAAGRPVLCIAPPESDEARLVEDHDVGVQIDPSDESGVATVIREWRSNPGLVERQGERARRVLEENYTKEVSIDQYYRLLS